MEKYYCHPTQFCNILILKLEVDPPLLNGWNNCMEHKVLTRNAPGINSIRQVPYFIDIKEAFDSYAQAEVHARRLAADLQTAQIDKIEKVVQHHQKRLDKMRAKVPTIRRIVCG